MKQFKLHTINTIYKYILRKRYKSFMDCLSDSVNCQRSYLMARLELNADTLYGRKYHFNRIRTVSEYRNDVPLVRYDDISDYIDLMKNGQSNVLFYEPLVMFEKSSGSISATKYIPFNRSLLDEIHNGTSAWIYNIYHKHAGLTRTTAYWSISPKLGSQEYTQGGIKVGFDDDSEYFAPLERIFLKHLFAVDPHVSKLESNEYRMALALSLISDEKLGLISIWNPTLFVLVLEYIESNKIILINELRKRSIRIPRKRLLLIETLFKRDAEIDFQALWPNLQFISCWTDGAASLFMPSLKKYFPDIYTQGKGLLMTEGVITIPLVDMDAPVLCINSHFYEFIEYHHDQRTYLQPDQPTLLHHELEKGKEYIPVITTGGGLYRYITDDRVYVKGFYNDVPLLQFMGRCNNIVDLCGEKLNESFVSSIVIQLNQKYNVKPDFSMMSPTLTPEPHYIYYIEANHLPLSLSDLANEFEKLLCENYHYNLCRTLGQLSPVEIVEIKQGHCTYIETLVDTKHQKYGNIKNKLLDSNLFWNDKYKAINTSSSAGIHRLKTNDYN